jgi:hypothetical protein
VEELRSAVVVAGAAAEEEYKVREILLHYGWPVEEALVPQIQVLGMAL